MQRASSPGRRTVAQTREVWLQASVLHLLGRVAATADAEIGKGVGRLAHSPICIAPWDFSPKAKRGFPTKLSGFPVPPHLGETLGGTGARRWEALGETLGGVLSGKRQMVFAELSTLITTLLIPSLPRQRAKLESERSARLWSIAVPQPASPSCREGQTREGMGRC